MRLSADVQYYSDTEVSLDITNRGAEPLLIEDITLQFPADRGSASIYVDCTCAAELQPGGLAPVIVRVSPTAKYLEHTNVFEVMVHYRTRMGGHLGCRVAELHHGSYLIVRAPIKTIGDVFISFKQPESVSEARLLERYSRRAGLNPYLILEDKQPGTSHWHRIEEAIRRSRTAYVIAENERNGVTVSVAKWNFVDAEVLVLERDLPVPELFEAAALENEYSRFIADDPAESFAAAVGAVRSRLL